MNTETKKIEIEKAKETKNADANLERLKKQKMIIEARIQSAEARLKVSGRKQDTRRKILLGSYYLEKANGKNKENEMSQMNEIKKIMDGYLTRNSDRKLFDLPEIENSTKLKKNKY